MSTVRMYPTAEFLVSSPHETNNWRWCWSVYLPDVQGTAGVIKRLRT